MTEIVRYSPEHLLICGTNVAAANFLSVVEVITCGGHLSQVPASFEEFETITEGALKARAARRKAPEVASWGFITAERKQGRTTLFTYHADRVAAALASPEARAIRASLDAARSPELAKQRNPNYGTSPIAANEGGDNVAKQRNPNYGTSPIAADGFTQNQQLTEGAALSTREVSSALREVLSSQVSSTAKTLDNLASKIPTNHSTENPSPKPKPIPAGQFTEEQIETARYQLMLAMNKCAEDRHERTYFLDDIDALVAIDFMTAAPWELLQDLLDDLSTRGTLKVKTVAYFRMVAWTRFQGDGNGWLKFKRRKPTQAVVSRAAAASGQEERFLPQRPAPQPPQPAAPELDFGSAIAAIAGSRRMR